MRMTAKQWRGAGFSFSDNLCVGCSDTCTKRTHTKRTHKAHNDAASNAPSLLCGDEQGVAPQPAAARGYNRNMMPQPVPENQVCTV